MTRYELDGRAAMVARTESELGPLRIAVNNAGIGGTSQPTGEYDLEAWRRVMSVNLDGVFYCLRAQIGPIFRAGGDSIVNMASVLGSVGIENSPAYVAAKHGVVGLTKAAALESTPPRASASTPWAPASSPRPCWSRTSPPRPRPR